MDFFYIAILNIVKSQENYYLANNPTHNFVRYINTVVINRIFSLCIIFGHILYYYSLISLINKGYPKMFKIKQMITEINQEKKFFLFIFNKFFNICENW